MKIILIKYIKLYNTNNNNNKIIYYLKMFSMLKKAKEGLKNILDDEPKFNGYMDSCFEKVDTDNSGYIEEKELETLIKKVTELFKFKKIEVTEEQINNALKLMDTDKDGKISKEEFRKTSRTKLLAIVNDNSS